MRHNLRDFAIKERPRDADFKNASHAAGHRLCNAFSSLKALHNLLDFDKECNASAR